MASLPIKKSAVLVVFALVVSALPAAAAPPSEDPPVDGALPEGIVCLPGADKSEDLPEGGPYRFTVACAYNPAPDQAPLTTGIIVHVTYSWKPAGSNFSYPPGGQNVYFTASLADMQAYPDKPGGTFVADSLVPFPKGQSEGLDWNVGACHHYSLIGVNTHLTCHSWQAPGISNTLTNGLCASSWDRQIFVDGLIRCEADPVNTATGAYTSSRVDLSAPSPTGIPLALDRNYNSQDPSEGYFGVGSSSVLEMRLVGAGPSNPQAGNGGTAPGFRAKFGGHDLSLGVWVSSDGSYPPVPGEPVTGPINYVGTSDLSSNPRPPVHGQAIIFRSSGGSQAAFIGNDTSYLAQEGVQGKLEDWTYANGSKGYRLSTPSRQRFYFNDAGQIYRITDYKDQGLTFAYANGSDKPISITDAAGTKMDLVFDGDRLSSASLPDGRTVNYGYTDGHLTSVTDPAGGITQYGYDGDLVTDITDPDLNHVVHNEYDAQGRVVAQTDGENNTGEFFYPQVGTTEYVDANGNKTTDYYSSNVLQKTVNAEGEAITYTRDANLDLVGLTDAREKTWTMTYLNHDLMSVTGPPGTNISESYTYDTLHRVTSIKETLNPLTSFAYAGGSLSLIDRPGSADTSFTTRAATGQVLSTTTNGHTTEFDYDSTTHRLIGVDPPLGGDTAFGYDASGRVNRITDPRGSLTSDPDDFTSTLTYDALDRVVATTDPLGNVSRNLYTPAGRLCRSIDAIGNASLAIPPTGCLDSPTLAGETVYGYNGRGDLESIRTADQETTTYGYDLVGNLASSIDAKGLPPLWLTPYL